LYKCYFIHISDSYHHSSFDKKRQIYNVTGIPWITFEGTRTSMTRDQYTKWHEENKCVAQNMQREVINITLPYY